MLLSNGRELVKHCLTRSTTTKATQLAANVVALLLSTAEPRGSMATGSRFAPTENCWPFAKGRRRSSGKRGGSRWRLAVLPDLSN